VIHKFSVKLLRFCSIHPVITKSTLPRIYLYNQTALTTTLAMPLYQATWLHFQLEANDMNVIIFTLQQPLLTCCDCMIHVMTFCGNRTESRFYVRLLPDV